MLDNRNQAPTSRTQQEWNTIVSQVQSKFPGIFDLLQVYGGYAQAVHEANAYLSLIRIPSLTTTSDRTTRG